MTTTRCKNVFELCTDFLQDLLGDDAQAIAESDIWRFVSQLEIHRLAAGEVLCVQGDTSQEAYILVGGSIEGCVEYASEPHPKMFRLSPGAVLGEIGLLTGLPHTATLRANEHAELFKLSRAAFVTLLSLEPRIPQIMADLAMARQVDDATYFTRLEDLSEATGEAISTEIDPLSGLAAFCRLLLDARS